MADVAKLGIKFEAQPVSAEKLAGPVQSMAAQAGGGGGGAGGGSGPPVVLNGGGAADDDGESGGGGDVRSIGQRVHGYVAKVLESLKSLNPGAVQDELSQIDRIQAEWQALLRSRREEMEERYKQQRELFKNQDFDALSAIMGTSSIDKMREMLDEAKDQARGRFFLELNDEFDMLAKSVGLSDTNKRAFFARRQRELDAEDEQQQEEEGKRPRFQRWAGAANQWAGGGFAGGVAGGVAGAVSLAGTVAERVPGVAGFGMGMASSVGRMDTEGVGRGFAVLASMLPGVGTAMGLVTHGFLGLSASLERTEERLSAFSGVLAQQQASEDIRRIQMDIDRAQRFGPQMAQASETRFQVEAKLQATIDEFFPQVLEIGNSLARMFSSLIDILKPALNVAVNVLQFLAELIETIVDLLKQALITLGLIEDNTAPESAGGYYDIIDILFSNSLAPAQQQPPASPGPQAMPTFN